MDETKVFDTSQIEEELIKNTLYEVFEILEERGYNPVEQMAGYLISGDPGYITSHKEARNKIIKFDRNHILEVILKSYVKR